MLADINIGNIIIRQHKSPRRWCNNPGRKASPEAVLGDDEKGWWSSEASTTAEYGNNAVVECHHRRINAGAPARILALTADQDKHTLAGSTCRVAKHAQHQIVVFVESYNCCAVTGWMRSKSRIGSGSRRAGDGMSPQLPHRGSHRYWRLLHASRQCKIIAHVGGSGHHRSLVRSRCPASILPNNKAARGFVIVYGTFAVRPAPGFNKSAITT